MKIGIDARNLTDTTGRYVERLLNYLQEIDQQNDYVIFLNQAGFEKWQPKVDNFSAILADYSIYGADGQFAYARLLKKQKLDLMHFSFQQTPLPYRGKTVITVHDLTQLRFKNTSKNRAGLSYSAKQKILKAGIKRSVKKARAVIVPSHFVAKDLVQTFDIDPTKITVTYEAADEPQALNIQAVAGLDGPFILYVGTSHEHKNLNRLVGAFNIVRKNYPDLKLVLAGKKTIFHERLQAYTKQKSVKNVVFTDYVSEPELAWLYKNCRAYVFPSLSEGFGLPGLEAMVHGAPVISSNATCLPEIYDTAAHYFDPKSEPDMAKAIVEVLGSSELQATLIKNGNKRIKKFSWLKMAEETLAVYKKAFSEN